MQSPSWSQSLTELWWIRLPLSLRRVAITPVIVLVDGIYIAVWPRVAAFLSPLVFAIGLVIGWLHPGYEQVFSQSWLVLILAILIGVLSGHLGALFLVGYAIGDFFLWQTDWTYAGSLWQNLLRIRVPLLIQYGLLAFATTTVPVATKALLVQLRPPASLSRPVRLALAFLGHLGLTLLLVYLWIQVVPILIRPVFTWFFRPPPVDAMVILQRQYWPLLLVAGLASMIRVILQATTAARPIFSDQLDTLEEKLNAVTPVVPLSVRVPVLVRVGITAVWSTLMLSGMFEAWWDGLILGIVIILLQAAREGLIPVPLGPWPRLISHVPLLLRLAAGAFVITYVSRVALQNLMTTTNSFRPILMLTILALLIFYLLNPLRPESQAAEDTGTRL